MVDALIDRPEQRLVLRKTLLPFFIHHSSGAMDPPRPREPLQAGRRRPLGTVTRPTSVEAQDRFLDLLTATVCEAAVDANASEPSLLQHSKRSDVVRGRAGVHRSFGSLCKNDLQCCARDAFPPVRSAHPVGHLKLIVDSEGTDRSSDYSVDLYSAVRHVWIGAEARRPLEKRAAIGPTVRCERGHADRLQVRHLLIDRVEIRVVERPQRDVHLTTLRASSPTVPGSRLGQRSRMSPEDRCELACASVREWRLSRPSQMRRRTSATTPRLTASRMTTPTNNSASTTR